MQTFCKLMLNGDCRSKGPLWVKSGLFSLHDFGKDISLFRDLYSLIPRKNSLLIYLGNLGEETSVTTGYRGVKFTDRVQKRENSLYFPCLTEKSLQILPETSSPKTTPTTILPFVKPQPEYLNTTRPWGKLVSNETLGPLTHFAKTMLTPKQH